MGLQAVAEHDVAFEDIVSAPERELAALAGTLGLVGKVRLAALQPFTSVSVPDSLFCP